MKQPSPVDPFDRSSPTPAVSSGWESEERKLQLRHDTERARFARVRWIIGGVLSALLLVGWWSRWEIVAQPNGQARGMVIAVDRLTGTFYLVDADRMDPIPQK